MATPSDAASPALTAAYANQSAAAPSEPFTHRTPLPAPADPAGPPTAYLHALRQAVLSTQERINTDLTARMGEDKAREAAAAAAAAAERGQTATGADQAGSGRGKNKKKNNSGAKRRKVEVDEDAEEANYGEEVVDAEDD